MAEFVGDCMGKRERDEHWKEHERAVAKAEKAKAKSLMDDKSKAWRKAWRKACADYLLVNNYCHDCAKRGYTSPAEQVAHFIDPTSQVKFWNIQNWQALCEPCFQRINEGKTLTVHEPIPKDAKLYTVK